MAYVIAWGLFVLGVLLTIYFWQKGFQTRSTGMYGHWRGDVLAAIWAFGILSIIVGAIASICTFVPPYAKGRCEYWGEQVERDVKFIRTSFWSWDCYIHTDEGWIYRGFNVKVDD